jgi:endonuclease/exonuclease/phosphatase family metal-dependent hydrolase
MRRLPPAARTFALAVATLLAVSTPALGTAHADASTATAKLATPDKLTSAKGVPGPQPGETTIVWETTGRYTDHYRITTALTPFGTRHTPKVGRHSTTFVVDGSRRSLTLTPSQTTAAGAGLRTGRHLFFRIKAVNTNGSTTTVKAYPYLRHATIKGQASTMTGTRLRFAEYNVHVRAADVRGHPWKRRQHLVARAIARTRPAVVGVQELVPAMWTHDDGGIGLHASLRRAGAASYRLTRTTGYFHRAPQDTRILYDSNRVRMVSSCPNTKPSCYISLPNPEHRMVAAWARFEDLASGQQFLFVSAHLSNGNDGSTDALRGRQAEAIDAGIRAINGRNLPVVFATDANSSQTSRGVDAPHAALYRAGWYNTLAAAQTVNGRYNSVNCYKFPQHASPYGFGSMYDSVLTLNMPGADLSKQMIAGAPGPSDHNLVITDVRLPHP